VFVCNEQKSILLRVPRLKLGRCLQTPPTIQTTLISPAAYITWY